MTVRGGTQVPRCSSQGDGTGRVESGRVDSRIGVVAAQEAEARADLRCRAPGQARPGQRGHKAFKERGVPSMRMNERMNE
jgi:hypothetical protein